MADYVRLVSDNGDGTLAVAHGAHAGNTPVVVAPGGSGLLLECPVCGTGSFWPVTGGALPEMAPELGAIVEAAPEEAPKAGASKAAARKRRA